MALCILKITFFNFKTDSAHSKIHVSGDSLVSIAGTTEPLTHLSPTEGITDGGVRMKMINLMVMGCSYGRLTAKRTDQTDHIRTDNT